MGSINDPKQYKKNSKTYHPKQHYVLSCLKAFLVGGFICLIGECIEKLYLAWTNFNQSNVGNPTVATMILISSLLTGLGVYDKFGQFAGAGTLVPVTGFANSITSAALEHRSEGIVLGIATNLFKLAGAVIVFGVVSAAVFGIIRLTITNLLG